MAAMKDNLNDSTFDISLESGLSREVLLDLIEKKICQIYGTKGESILLSWCYQLDIDEGIIPKLNDQNIQSESKKLSLHILKRLEQKRLTRQN